MSRLLYRWGRWSARRPWVAIGVWLTLTAAVVGASAGLGTQLEDTMAAPGTDSQAAADLLAASGSAAGGITAYVVATPRDSAETFVDSGAARADLVTLQRSLADLPQVLGTSDPAAAAEAGPAAADPAGEVSADGRTAVVRVQYPPIERLDAGDLTLLEDAINGARDSSSLNLEAGGDLHFSFGDSPSHVGELVGLGLALVILLVAFGSLLAAGLPLAVALLGLVVGASALPLVAHVVDIPVWSTAMAAMVGLGVGIDYALFMLTRFREQLALGHTVPEAVGRAVATAGQAVVFAGGIVVLSILGLTFAGLPFVAAGGVGIAVVVLVMALAAVTLLPALLGLAGSRLARGGLLRRRRGAEDASVRRWTRWGAPRDTGTLRRTPSRASWS